MASFASTLDLSVVNNPPKFCVAKNGLCTQPEASVWSGRAVTAVKDGLYTCAASIAHVFQNTIRVLGSLIGDTNELSAVFKRLQLYTVPLIETLKGTPNKFAKLKNSLQNCRDSIDLFQLADDAVYFARGDYKKSSSLSVAGRISLFVTNVTGTAAWLTSLGVINLGKAAKAIGNLRIFSLVPAIISSIPGLRDMPRLNSIANTIGNVRVFSFINKISLGFVAERALGLAYVFWAADAFRRLISSESNVYQKTQAAIDLASKSIMIALDAMMLVGVTCAIGFGVLGTVSLGLTLTNYVYSLYHDKELKAQPLND